MEEIVDYARPTIMAERALKLLHEAVLKGDYKEAKDWALQAMADCRLAYHSLVVMEEKQ